jgi:hypothetical protein
MYLTDMRPLPAFTADWRRLRGRPRGKRLTKRERKREGSTPKSNAQDTEGARLGNITSSEAQGLEENWYRPTGQLD